MALSADVVATGDGVTSPGGPDDYRRFKRRSWTVEEKLAIVAEAESSDETVASVARRHGMNANHLFNWIQRARDGVLDRRRLGGASSEAMTFIDLGVTGSRDCDAEGRIEIDLPNGARVRVGPAIEPEALRRVLAAVKAAL
jgi:transposase